MKNVVILFLSLSIFCSCSTTKLNYLNVEGYKISKSEINSMKADNEYLAIRSVQANQLQLVKREKDGVVDRQLIETTLENQNGLVIEDDKPLVIIYHAGTGPKPYHKPHNFGEDWIRNWYGTLDTGLEELDQIKAVYICKELDILQAYQGLVEWKLDPEQIIENTFFDHDYPRSSFVVIGPNGKYISYFGEFEKEQVWEASRLLSSN